VNRQQPRLGKQSGIALIALLVLLIMAGAYAFYRNVNIGTGRIQQDAKLAATLARAKEALIARAVTDANRPGSLPCPDLITDSAGLHNAPYDGKRDDFIGAATAQCPSYVGWLPWVTLDLPELVDNSGSRLWYVLPPALRDDDSAQPINSDTNPGLTVDGNANNDVAALIIAPRGALTGQDRTPPAGKTYPAPNPAAHLDGENGNGDDRIYISGPQGPAFNDMVVAISRQELMAAVEKRVANEVRHCIEQHVAASANTAHSYPWPAPFSATGFQGKAGSYFGRLPKTQPGAGPEAALKQDIAQIQAARSALTSATTPQDQLTAVQRLGEALTQARNLYDALYVAATRLWQSASAVVTSSASLDSELARDLTPSSTGRVSIIDSEQTRIRAQAQTLRDQIDTLPVALDQSGIDAFPNALKTRADLFQQQASVANAQAIQLLLASSTTSHADIGPALAEALAKSTSTFIATSNLAQAPGDTGLAAIAQDSATKLVKAINTLQTTINSSRINRHYSEISPFATQITSLNDLLRSTPNTTNSATLAAKLSETKILLQGITTGASAINTSRSDSLYAINQALTAALAAADYSLIDSTASAAVASLNTLVNTMIVNDDNLTRTSLAVAVGSYNNEQTIFATINILLTSARAPYAVNLQNATVNVEFWANIIKSEANSLASQAKGLPIAAGQDFSSVTPLGTSAYQGADTALASSQAAATAIQTYINTPTAAKQTLAANALADTVNAAASALGDANALDTTLSSSAASAFPIIWLSSSCDAFRDTANSWWTANQWQGLVFYQISDATLSAAPGRLTVNQAGNYRVVVISAGRALSGQNRSIPNAANYFEQINADASRNGDASAPVSTFSNALVSGTFNDRLAY
jgi:hypothetical protein